MRKILALLTLSLVLTSLLTSCTSNEGAVKKASVADAESLFGEVLQKEANDLIPQSDWLRDAYVAFMKKHSEFEAEKVEMLSETLAVATVTVTTYPLAQRRVIAKIAGTVSPDKVRQFNFGNAISLVAQQTGMPMTAEKQSGGVFKYHKNSSGDWLLEK